MQPIVDTMDLVLKIGGAILALIVFFKFLILCTDIYTIRRHVQAMYHYSKTRMVEDGLYDQPNQRIKDWSIDSKTGYITPREKSA